jgi:hypothetical protein
LCSTVEAAVAQLDAVDAPGPSDGGFPLEVLVTESPGHLGRRFAPELGISLIDLVHLADLHEP